jgi:tetratricopeptide (TPR) repeat protein
MNAERRALCKRLFKVCVGLSLVLSAMALLLTGWGSAVLPGLSKSLAEVALEQGERREAAGNLTEARVFYEQALAGRFHGEANRNHCEKRLGVVLLRLGEHEAALEHLARAQGSPLRSVNGFGPLVEALMALGRWEEAKREAERWLVESGDEPTNRASAHQALGMIALESGELDDAERHFQEALSANTPNAARAGLARVYAARGDRAKARDTMAEYLASAPPDKDTAAHWALLESWMP